MTSTNLKNTHGLKFMSNIQRISRVFWNYFSEDIQSDIPVYFNFSKYLVSNLVASEFSLNSSDDGFNFFLTQVRGSLDVTGNKVRVKQTIFEDSNGFSNVISIIALQVIAAEHMSKQETLYTSSAYFPPLRKLISDNLGTDSVLPFYDDEFNLLWSVFRSEVKKLNPNAYLTFDVVGKGLNLNRIFPLSQALLNQRDLVLLASTFYMQGRKLSHDKGGDFNWRTFLISNSRRLSTRGQFCVLNEGMRTAVIEQLQVFIEKFSISEILKIEDKIKKSLQSFQVLISENDEDIFGGDDCTIRHEFFDDSESPIDEFSGKNLLFNYLEKKHYLIVRQVPGAWRGDPKLNFEDSMSRLCFIARDKEFVKYVESSIGVLNISFNERVFETEQGYKLYYISDDRLSHTSVNVLQGVLRSLKSEVNLRFYGGLSIDNRANNYFSEFPPLHLVYQGRNVDRNEIILVNSKEVTCEEFFDVVLKDTEQSFTISYKGLKTSLYLRRADENLKLVGCLVEDRKLVLRNRPVSNLDKSVVGFNFFNVDSLISFDRSDFLEFFIPEPSYFEKISNAQVQLVVDSLAKSNIGPAQKNYITIYLLQTGSAPKKLVDKIRKAVG